MWVEVVPEMRWDYEVDGKGSSGGLVVLGKWIARSWYRLHCTTAALCVQIPERYCRRSWGKVRYQCFLFLARSAFTLLKMPIFFNDKCKYLVTRVCSAFNAVCLTALRLRHVSLVECSSHVTDDESVTVQGYWRLGVRLVSADMVAGVLNMVLGVLGCTK